MVRTQSVSNVGAPGGANGVRGRVYPCWTGDTGLAAQLCSSVLLTAGGGWICVPHGHQSSMDTADRSLRGERRVRPCHDHHQTTAKSQLTILSPSQARHKYTRCQQYSTVALCFEGKCLCQVCSPGQKNILREKRKFAATMTMSSALLNSDC